ncbi:MAG: hypothetical protein WKG06_38925 [Segetibacter sp.]
MSEKNITIKTYDKQDDLVRIIGKINLPNSGVELNIPENNSINLFNYPLPDGQNLRLREKEESLFIKISIGWEKGASLSDLQRLVDETERSYDILRVRSQCYCKESKWCSQQKKIGLLEIGKDALLVFEIPLNEVKGSIFVTVDITAETTLKKTKTFKSTESYSIVSSARSCCNTD